MVPFVEPRTMGRTGPVALNWLGRSGQLYPLMPVSLAELSLSDDELTLLVRQGKVLWVGSAEDVVGDPQSRTRFRWALEAADAAFSLAAEPGTVERLILRWDLEEAEPVSGVRVA